MRISTLSKYALAALALVVGSRTYAEVAPPSKLYAFMNNASAWSEGNNEEPYYGFYSFAPDGSTGFVPVSPTGYDYCWALSTNGGGGGIYDDGYFYCYRLGGSYYNYQLTFSKVDSKTWQTVASGVATGKTNEPIYVPVDLTANPVDGNIYAVCRPKYSNSDYGVLCTVNRQNGDLTKVREMAFMRTISCDAKGNLYGIDGAGDLYKIPLSGDIEKIGATGLFMNDMEQSATIDFRTNKMYITHYGRGSIDGKVDYNSSVQGLYEIDLTTGKASNLHHYGDYEHLSALSILNSHPDAPDLIADLAFAPKSVGSFTGVVTFTVPSVTYGQEPLTAATEATLYLDGVKGATLSATPGQIFSHEIEITGEGNHTITVVLSANGHDGVQASETAYFGTDAPASISNLKLTTDADHMVATLTWDAPEGSVNGGNYDPESVRYTIVRYPGAVTVQRAASACEFTENIDQEYTRTYYKVTPYINGDTNKKGATATSNKEFLGRPWDMPYAEPFFTESAITNSFTIIDANEDGGNWEWEDPVWKFDPLYGCAFFYHWVYSGPSDDWLITPKLNLDPSKLYRLTFQLYGYYEGREHHIRVLSGSAPTVEGMHQVIYDETEVSTQQTMLTITRDFAPAAGDQYIGFHNLTVNPQHVSIDNILVEEIGLASVPAKVENLEAQIVDRRNGKLNINFNAPSVDAAGNNLTGNVTIKIYRATSDEPIATFEAEPGKAISFADTQAAVAVNIYRITVENEYGMGIESSLRVDLRSGEPQSVSNVMATLLSPSQVALTWNAPEGDVDAEGNPIDNKNIRYLVYRPRPEGGSDMDLIGRGLKECQFIDNNPSAAAADGKQTALKYYVAAVNADGESIATASNVIYIGESYQLPFAETWFQQAPATMPWLQGTNGSASWVLAAQGYAPFTAGQDGYGLLSLDVNVGYEVGFAEYWSPRIDFSNSKAATLTFYLFGDNSYKDTDFVQVAVDVEGKGSSYAGTKFYPKKFAGWKLCTVDLTPYVGNSRVSVIFMGQATMQGDERRIHIDNMNISSVAANKDLKAVKLDGPQELRRTAPAAYTFTVANNGTKESVATPVTLYADDEVLAEATVPALAVGESADIEFTFTVPVDFDDIVELKAEIEPTAGNDEIAANNSTFLAVTIRSLNLPYVTDLRGIFNPEAGQAELEWGNPAAANEAELILDDVETYDPFAISEIGSYTLIDGDQTLPFKFQDPDTGTLIKWDNNDQLQAWMVFTPEEVTSNRTFATYSGRNAFVSWAAAGRNNDDWLISPELSGEEQLISFFVRRLNERDTKEHFNVLYSTTDTDPASFRPLNGDEVLSAGAEWEPIYFVLPEGTRYFAIQYVGYHQSAIMIDDLQFEAYPTHMRPDGFNIYRDGVLLNSKPTSRKYFTDTTLDVNSKPVYTVHAVYNGIEAPESNQFILDPAGVSAVSAKHPTVFGTRGKVVVSALTGTNVAIYAPDGRICYNASLRSERETIDLPAGIYIVKAGNVTAKVTVK